MNKKIRALLLFIGITLMVGGGVLGAYAYFTDTTDVKANVFTVGKVEITLDETDIDDSTQGADKDKANSYIMVPGVTLPKDPMVTVKAGSNDCWVFVEVIDEVKTYNGNTYKASDFLTYKIATEADSEGKWKKLEGTDNVYYYNATNVNNDISLQVLDGNEVIVKDVVTKEMMGMIGEGKEPQLKFKAYAFQLQKGDTNNDGVTEQFTAKEAWAQLNA